MPSIASSGQCRRCGRTVSREQMSRHLASCLGAGNQLLMKVEAPHSPYFVYFTAFQDTTWENLDDVLRGVWLDCCGHLSAFRVGSTSFESSPDDDGLWSRRRGMDSQIMKDAPLKAKIRYEYDFGTTTELEVTIVADDSGGVGPDRLLIAARNDAPDISCVACEKSASTLSGWDYDAYCDQHAPTDEHFVWPVVNSPRMGLCAYTGPSIEPR